MDENGEFIENDGGIGGGGFSGGVIVGIVIGVIVGIMFFCFFVFCCIVCGCWVFIFGCKKDKEICEECVYEESYYCGSCFLLFVCNFGWFGFG